MTIREAESEDVDAIVNLLKLSLGDVSTEKSSTYWRWKHERNPFGPSHVLLAEEGGELVGVRAFMQWRWTDGSREFTALRAVDTATHPAHQGKGIFKRLTLEMIDRRRKAGDDFIFNTPNAQSKPGYLKMGWKELGRLPVTVKIQRPLDLVRHKLGLGRESLAPPRTSAFDWGQWTQSDYNHGKEGWYTAHRPDYLQWRYCDCPVADYLTYGESGRYLIVIHPKQSALGLECRIVHHEILAGGLAAAREALRGVIRQLSADIVTIAPGSPLSRWWWFTGLLGPELTYRPLNFDTPPAPTKWEYTLGDMELF
ncbi:GNAT superfamily N-acetyltransferase [Lewinella marina]|uniref:N-acetyltransferase domain-containing protein n=1 Tax=Neolewinella marina TaxID=438751 RepID=A0A2G0CBY3_9BACT|nr:GNAT family N-acetyltransferase [Neolewinella marina]NJB86676.1 GNAT superfamily N-acetyltransferase [Neolewinella marina]PHK97484.1 hypothetical protein CGL56_15405 [Neolewinella marina]